MAYFEHRTATDLNSSYGYRERVQSVNLDQSTTSLATHLQRAPNRVLEVSVTAAPVKTPEKLLCFTPEKRQEFLDVSRLAFRYIAQRHHLTPTVMWKKVEAGLQVVGMHPDDIEAVEQFLWGWHDFTQEEMERFRWRYPDRCPLLDVFCSFDDTLEPLNNLQDWLLEMKGSKGRRRNDVLPPFPDPSDKPKVLS